MFFWINCKVQGFTIEHDAEFPTIEEAEKYVSEFIKNRRIIEKQTIVKTIITQNENV